MFVFKFVAKGSRELFKFESVRRDLILLSINFMDENEAKEVFSSSHVYVATKRHI